ncbi:hypothetical protein DSO57_1034713 [Entomophthora muscae]|uniref:Uncharacterized protein n=1 Tax=Entomophthora muscae TaxID=34485 RepID=A0ACC2REF6_9FUNG|nr:hypothetical protein DSO57_1034713 [Entomophthora muscae]
MPADFAAPPPILENENCVNSQCPEFYAEDALMLSQVIYLGLLWLGLIVLLNPGVTIPCWWLIINSMWIWVVIPHHLETASYYPVISVTEPTFLQATGPVDQEPACMRFFGIEPLQAEAPAKSQSQNTCTSSTMVAPKEEPLKLPNGSRDGTSVNFMSLKSSQVTNQTLLPKINPGFGPNPVTTAKNQEN